jgi:hypothetical protein
MMYKTEDIRGYQHSAAPVLPQREYVEEAQERRTIAKQLCFNSERLDILTKELHHLTDMLRPFFIGKEIVDPNLKEPEELNSEFMCQLLAQSSQINQLIRHVQNIQRDLQV